MSARQTRIEAVYRVSIPGTRLADKEGDAWTPFLMATDELLELYRAIKDTLGLDDRSKP